MIPENILLDFDVETISYKKGEVIFEDGAYAKFYFQVKHGGVKMYNLTEDGKEFTQSVFGPGKSFGEPPLFNNFKYPAAAAAVEKTELYRLTKDAFLTCLEQHTDIHMAFTKTLSSRLLYKATILKEVSVYPPEHRVQTFLDYLKAQEELDKGEDYTIPLTRQEISELIGLRTETVIRIIKKMESEGLLRIENRKVII